jgi:hypothetical protein
MADIELCGDRYAESVLELYKPLDIDGERPDFLLGLFDEIMDGSVALGSSKAA